MGVNIPAPHNVNAITEAVHSGFGASIMYQVLGCPGSVNACRGLEDETNDAAEEGAAQHELAEWCLRLGFNAIDGLGKTFNKRFIVDEVMAQNVQIYLNHIRSIRINYPGISYVEGKVRMSSVANDIYGTADHIHICYEQRTGFIDDYKGGFLVVDEEENPQTAHYAVSMLDTYKLWFTLDKVVCTIIQPNGDHVRGDIRSVTYTIDELMVWRDTFSKAISAARQKDAKRIAGEHCRYCLANTDCRPRMLRTILKCSFDAPINQVSDEEVNDFIREIPTFKKTIERMEKHALWLARGGKRYKDFKLVKGVVKAICTDEAALVAEALAKGITKDRLYNPGKIKGKSVLKPLLGQDVVDKYYETPVAETKLVPLSNSSTAVGNNASGVFTQVD